MTSNTGVTKIFQDRLEDLVKSRIQKIGITQNGIAKKVGINQSSLSAYLNDEKEAGINTLCKIADYFDVSTDWLLGRSDVQSPDIDIQAAHKKFGLSEAALIRFLEGYQEQTRSNREIFLVLNTLIEKGSLHALCEIIADDLYSMAAMTGTGVTVKRLSSEDMVRYEEEIRNELLNAPRLEDLPIDEQRAFLAEHEKRVEEIRRAQRMAREYHNFQMLCRLKDIVDVVSDELWPIGEARYLKFEEEASAGGDV